MKGLYIHIPFCIRKCLYCDFVSVTDGSGIFADYTGAVIKEAEEYRGEKIDTVFIGGGTPTVLPPELIGRLLEGIHRIFNIAPDAEITSEANPGTLDDGKISALLGGGVNRISVGVQSFNDTELKAVGRIHDAKTAYNTVCRLSERGFSNISVDIMTALPGQDMNSIKNTLETAVSLPVAHISAYSLIIEEGTPLEKQYAEGKLTLPDDDADRDIYHFTVDFLREHGFDRYEISNFARRGFECRHNLKYWDCREYIGLGAAAHSYIGNRRFSNSRSVTGYMSCNEREETVLSRADEISEFMIMGLRKFCGVSEAEFKKRFGSGMENIFGKELRRFTELRLMEHKNGNYFLTDRGIDVSNSVMCDFILT